MVLSPRMSTNLEQLEAPSLPDMAWSNTLNEKTGCCCCLPCNHNWKGNWIVEEIKAALYALQEVYKIMQTGLLLQNYAQWSVLY